MNNKVSATVEREYAPHLVAFIDTLGYRKKFAPLKKDGTNEDEDEDEEKQRVNLEKIFISEFHETFISVIEDSDVVASYGMKRILFSDNVLLAIKIDESTQQFCSLKKYIIPLDLIHKMFAVISAFQLRCLAKGWLMRGALEFEYLFLNESFVAGRGLLETYELEHEARFPRIILGKNISEYLQTWIIQPSCPIDDASIEKERIKAYLVQRKSNRYYINCYQYLNEMKSDPRYVEEYGVLQDEIKRSLEYNCQKYNSENDLKKRAVFLIANYNKFSKPREKIKVTRKSF